MAAAWPVPTDRRYRWYRAAPGHAGGTDAGRVTSPGASAVRVSEW